MCFVLTNLRIVFCCRGTCSQFPIIPVSKCPHHHAIEGQHKCVVETTWHLKKVTKELCWVRFFTFVFLHSGDCVTICLRMKKHFISCLSNMISFKGSNSLRQHLVGCWPLPQTTRFTAAEGKQFPIRRYHSRVPETTSKLQREAVWNAQKSYFN